MPAVQAPPSGSGSYQILAELGRGAMGVVYRARQVALGREVALKLVTPDQPLTPEYVARFRREARSLSRVSHPNLVAVYDFGVLDDRPFIAMELIRGKPLSQTLREKPVEIRRRGDRIFNQVLGAIAAVHEAGLVHRDIKPANIMITPEGRAVVMDLGLVKDSTGNGTCITQLGDVVGTPMYLAPEVLSGSAVSPASDVWALGCVYFQINAGRPLFSADSLTLLVSAILADPLPDLARECPDLSPDRQAFLRRMLDRAQESRLQDAPAALTIFETQTPTVTTRPPSGPEHGPEKSPWALLAKTSVIVIVPLIMLLMILRPARVPPTELSSPMGAGIPSPRLPAGASATVDPVVEALQSLDPRRLHEALCAEVDKRPRDLAARPPYFAALRSRWAERLNRAMESLRKLGPEGSRKIVEPSSPPGLPQTLDRYRAVAGLWQLQGQCQDLGLGLELDVSSLFPSAHCPLKSAPRRVHRADAILYGRDQSDFTQGVPNLNVLGSRQSDNVHFWTAEGGHQWMRDVSTVGLQVDRTSYVEPTPLPLPPPAVGEDAVLTISTKHLGPTESFSFAFSRDAAQWSSPVVVIRGASDEGFANYHHLLHQGLLDGPRHVRVTYHHKAAMALRGDAVLLGLMVQYVEHRDDGPAIDPGPSTRPAAGTDGP